MKKSILALAFLMLVSTLCAGTVPLIARQNTDQPRAFYTPDGKYEGVKAISNEAGNAIYRIDAQNATKKLIGGFRVPAEQDKMLILKLKLKVRKAGRIAAGFYMYDSNKPNKNIGMCYDKNLKVTPEQTEYEISNIVARNPNEKSELDRPAFGIMFFDFKVGNDLDIEAIEYSTKEADPVKSAQTNPPEQK